MSAVKFETSRLIVREFTLDDLSDCFEIYSQPQTVRYLKRDPVESLAQMETLLLPVIESFRGKPFGSWAIQHKESGRVIGSSILKPLPEDERIEVGWHLHPDHWRKGYATEAARGALGYGFGQQRLTEVFAILLPENSRSRDVAIRLGMSFVELTTQFHGLTLELHRIGGDEFHSVD